MLEAGSFKREVLQATIDKARERLDRDSENQARRIANQVGKLFG